MVFSVTFSQHYFSYIVPVSFIGGGNRSTHNVRGDRHWLHTIRYDHDHDDPFLKGNTIIDLKCHTLLIRIKFVLYYIASSHLKEKEDGRHRTLNFEHVILFAECQLKVAKRETTCFVLHFQTNRWIPYVIKTFDLHDNVCILCCKRDHNYVHASTGRRSKYRHWQSQESLNIPIFVINCLKI